MLKQHMENKFKKKIFKKTAKLYQIPFYQNLQKN